MKIESGKLVVMDYDLYLDSGELVDSSQGKEPLEYVQGEGSIIPKLENELEGLDVGDEREVIVSPGEGYGEFDPAKVQEIPLEKFPPEIDVQEGMTLYVRDPYGQSIPFLVREIHDPHAIVDFNHPLAGQTLRFKVTIKDVREAPYPGL